MIDHLISAAVCCVMIIDDWKEDELREIHKAIHHLEMAQDEKLDDGDDDAAEKNCVHEGRGKLDNETQSGLSILLRAPII